MSYSADVACPGPLPSYEFLITSVAFVFHFTQMFFFLSRYVMFNVVLYISVCAGARMFFACLMSAQISAPSIIAGNTHEM